MNSQAAGIAASAIKLVGRTTPESGGDRQLPDGAPILLTHARSPTN
jgi:hypothetical protein